MSISPANKKQLQNDVWEWCGWGKFIRYSQILMRRMYMKKRLCLYGDGVNMEYSIVEVGG